MEYFEITTLQPASLTNVNTRGEKHGPKDKVLAIDIDFDIGSVPPAVIAILLCCTEKELITAFWKKGDLKFHNLTEKMDLDVEFEDRYQVHLGRTEDRARKVKKFKITPRGGEVFDLHCQVQVSEPTDAFVKAANKFLIKDAVSLELTPIPDLFAPAEDPESNVVAM